MSDSKIQFFNTLSGKLEEFVPLKPQEVKMYTCGPTVYDYAHIGNFRAFVFEDLLRRFLEFQGYKVKHVMNLTDVDDKTIAGAQKEGRPLEEYTAKYIQSFNEDLKTLNILRPAEQPRATREITGPGGMIELIEKLIKKGIAYVTGGSVYYRISEFKNYGKLSKKKLDQNIAGASERVDTDEYDKEQVSDFVLWKKAKEGEPSWDSPWGKGRPGWHIECSSMSMKYLGETFDIHAGGEDLVFPHHENEIAQSEGATGKKFVDYWLHCRFLLVNGEKMSKSKGNFYTLRDLLAKGYDPMAIRFGLLSTHYRTHENFTFDKLSEALIKVEYLRDCYRQCLKLKKTSNENKISSEELEKNSFNLPSHIEDTMKMINSALSNDLNISIAFAKLFDVVRNINFGLDRKLIDAKALNEIFEFFEKVERLFGLNICEEEIAPEEVLVLHQFRSTIRNKPEFKSDPELQKQSDVWRTEIEKHGWIVRDGRPGEPSFLKKKRNP